MDGLHLTVKVRRDFLIDVSRFLFSISRLFSLFTGRQLGLLMRAKLGRVQNACRQGPQAFCTLPSFARIKSPKIHASRAVKVIPQYYIAHPYCARFLRHLTARPNQRVHVNNDRNFTKAKLDSEVNARFLLSENGDLLHNSSEHTILLYLKKN